MDYEAICKKIIELEAVVKTLQAKVVLLTNKCQRHDTSFETIRSTIKELRKKPKTVALNPTETDNWRK